MSWALGAVVVVLAVAIAFMARRMVTAGTELKVARAELRQASSDTATARTETAAARTETDRVSAELDRIRAELAATEGRAASLESGQAALRLLAANAPLRGETRLTALWGLTNFELARAWPLDLPNGGPEGPGPGAGAPSSTPDGSLAAALANEVERIREETGTPGTVRSDLDPSPAAPVSEAVWRTCKALLGVLVRHTQAFDVVLRRQGTDLVATVVCEGWEGPESVADDISELYAVVAPSGIHLEVDQDAEGRVRATLRVPESN